MFVSTVTVFENVGVSGYTTEFVSGEVWLLKSVEKIERLGACNMVESWRFKMFQ